MNVALSYSVEPSDLFTIPLLSRQITSNDMTVVSEDALSVQSRRPSLFIGVLGARGPRQNAVIAAYQQAHRLRIPALLMIEQNIRVPESWHRASNIVFFDRRRPDKAIEEIWARQARANKEGDKSLNGWAIVLGAFAIIGLIELLSDNKK